MSDDDHAEARADAHQGEPPAGQSGPFALPKLPPTPPSSEAVEVLRLVVRVKRNGERDFLAVVQRDDDGGGRLAGCRATDALAAVQGASVAAVEALRSVRAEARP